METQVIYQSGPHKAIKQTEGDLQVLPKRVKNAGIVYFINIQTINQIFDFNEKFDPTTTE